MQDYLQSLNKKPSAKSSLQWDKFDELNDNDTLHGDKQPHTAAAAVLAGGGSKFIKKKIEPKPQQLAQTHRAGDATLPSALGSANARSSALGKAQSFTAKYNTARGMTSLPSDSDADLSLSLDEDVLADMHAAKHTGWLLIYYH